MTLIAYMVSSFEYNNTGMGGHYYTASSIFKEMVKHAPAMLMVIGDLEPAAIDFSLPGTHFFHVERTIRGKKIRAVRDFLESRKVSVVHAFDTYSFLFARLVGMSCDIRVFVTKCGGPRPKLHYYPRICPDVVFSPEDLAYFGKRAKWFNVEKPVLLPNRIEGHPVEAVGSGNEELPQIQVPGSVKILRIARICPDYQRSIFQAIELSNHLRHRGIQTSLYIVGYVQDKRVYRKIQDRISEQDFLLTEDKYTRNAARHLRHADIVVATGRGVMEACYSNKIICCSVHDAQTPFLMDPENFHHFFYYNFSSRAPRPPVEEDENLKKIVALLQNKDWYMEYCTGMREIRIRYFDIAPVVNTYLELYKNDRFKKSSPLYGMDLILHTLVSRMKLIIRKNQNSGRATFAIDLAGKGR